MKKRDNQRKHLNLGRVVCGIVDILLAYVIIVGILLPNSIWMITDYKYSITPLPFGNVRVAEYIGNDQSIIVPSRLMFFNISDFDAGVYQDNGNITSVYISEDVQVIPSFDGCANLEQLTFSENSTCKSVDGFSRCINLNNVVLPESAERIEVGAFSGCVSLENIYIPDSVTYIGLGAFETTLFEYNHKTDEYYIAGDEILLFYNGDTDSIVIPEGIKSVCESSLYDSYDGKTDDRLIYYPSTIVRIDPFITENTTVYCPVMSEIEIDDYDVNDIKGTIVAPEGSFLETFCKENNIKFRAMTSEEKTICEEKTNSVTDKVVYANEE
ncbi:leucine-rich repeat domain-containing protein [Butyrivibrio fibrisolvens]|uniref:leucine-rich repeat domain-containing protein n=1 Tax=Butyrivibrio fibrisolvens TaxID=831 RepID=UPI0003F5C3A6|nr:leucine-rich repeat domain-containing protein [Butyrivibrio fibrisolvens]